MALYLQMDGVDDYLVGPSITFDKVTMKFSVDATSTNSTLYIVDARGGTRVDAQAIGTASSYVTKSSMTLFRNPGIASMSVDGVVLSSKVLVSNQIYDVEWNFSRLTDTLEFFINYLHSATNTTKGRIYDIKFYDGATLLSHYDMTTGTVNDQTGNGRHATLTGGTWLDDGTGGTGTDGYTAFDLRQYLYSDGALNGDTKQSLFADATVQADTKQAIYSDTATGYDARFSLYQDGSTLYDTLQEFFSDGIVGSTPFDLRFVLYADNSAVFDSRQVWYADGVFSADSSQQIYVDSRLVGDIKLVLYADASIKSDMALRTYSDGTISFDTFQSLLEEWAEYNEVIRFVLNISRKQTSDIRITRKQNATLGITQRNQSELNL